MMIKNVIKILCITLFVINNYVIADESDRYIINSDDILSVSFWQQPELNSTVKVNSDGNIQLSIGGAIKAAGLSPEELSVKIVEKISLYNRSITNAVVTVVEYGSHRIYIMGEIKNPGKLTFERIPNLWEIISEAGGPTADANLNNVMIIRDKGFDGEKTISINVSEILRTNDFTLFPKIESGDNIYIPAVVGNVPSSGIDALPDQSNIIFIYGLVGTPGVYTFNKELNILEALITAGGPSIDAKLSDVRVIRKLGAYSSVIHVDVQRYANKSVPAFFLVKGGDTIFVPRKNIFRESFLWDFIMIASGAAISSVVYGFLK